MALPPVEMLTTASVACLIRGRKAMKSSAFGLGAAVGGVARVEVQDRRAPASAAAIACSAIWSAVTGRYGDIDGVWIDPVGAQVMMTFAARSISPISLLLRQCDM